jgi:hypothetical protein
MPGRLANDWLLPASYRTNTDPIARLLLPIHRVNPGENGFVSIQGDPIHDEDGLSPIEFEGFGPVRLFRSSFVKSWQRVIDLIKERRNT